jgi:hypothetical protein
LLQYKPRAEDRTSVMIRARLRGAGPERDACIVDVSSRGLSATADNPPRRGDFIELVVGDIILVGQVKWTSMRRFGMAFRERISVVGLLSGDGGDVTLGGRRAVQKRNDRKRSAAAGGGWLKKLEFLVLMLAGAGATFLVGDFAASALHSLDDAKAAMAGKRVS